jgi:hypothetical protein
MRCPYLWEVEMQNGSVKWQGLAYILVWKLAIAVKHPSTELAGLWSEVCGPLVILRLSLLIER